MIDIDPDKLRSSPFIIGLLGSIVALRSVPGASLIDRIVNVLSGSLMAGFLSPAVCEYFGFSTESMRGAAAFAFGLFGMNLASAITVWIKAIQLSDLLPWIRKKD